MAKLTKEVFIEALKSMTLLEIKELVDGIKEEFGVDPSNLVSSNSNVSDSQGEKVEKTKATVILKTFGDAGKKIAIIKEIREITGLGILDAKKLAETPNAVIKKDLEKAEAEEIKNKLEKLGATVELE
ncbi:50S ribosomal protein L7/L12 [Candidatus Phytoplasma ziziphi]|uniref:Large ribosomal subunit protein bL12 n=1 Tax=Ziziphus jujuba witches'-broom phytoplasma TaxID=135727 RepID=A0A660HMS7_ZIZJU|nr:50S ribosomal protein L7/L12 [Candidatus Phytoplasma ziziphi]AYJ01343.1 50S ribosomal protein L7/L12 [Candidatus Phytoplasma ziziphi]